MGDQLLNLIQFGERENGSADLEHHKSDKQQQPMIFIVNPGPSSGDVNSLQQVHESDKMTNQIFDNFVIFQAAESAGEVLELPLDPVGDHSEIPISSNRGTDILQQALGMMGHVKRKVKHIYMINFQRKSRQHLRRILVGRWRLHPRLRHHSLC